MGIPAEWVGVIQKAGYNTIEQLKNVNPNKLHQEMCGLNKKLKLELPNPKIEEEYQVLRKPNGDAVQDLSVNNYLVMRNKVADPDFLLLQKIERRFSELYPDKYFPLYTMVSFTDIEYKTALEKGNAQENVIKELISKHGITSDTSIAAIDDIIHQQMTKNVLI